jgi:hypothetical protein
MKKVILLIVMCFTLSAISQTSINRNTSIGGQGDANYIPMFKAARTLTNSPISVSTNSNVGIGLIPSAGLAGKLQVTSTTLYQNGVEVIIPASNGAYGVYSESFIGFYGRNLSGYGYGVQGESTNNIGVYGSSTNGVGGSFKGYTGLICSSGDNSSTSASLSARDNTNTILFTVKGNGVINISHCPTSSTGLTTGDIYSNAVVLMIMP